MKKHIPDILSLSVICIAVGIFFFRLFWPIPQLIVTPDFGRSDAWHFSFGMKYALWQSLQRGTLPFWEDSIGDGFPLLAEGQTGALFLPNLILFSLPNPVTAYNLALVTAFLFLGFGMYWCVRTFGFSVIASVCSALTFTFSALPVLHLTHITLLQGMSLLPLLVALTQKIIQKRTPLWMCVWAIVGAEQLFTGFPQAVFITYGLCFLMIVWTGSLKNFALFFAAVLFSIFLAMAQLLPSWEFLQQSTHPNGFTPSIASLFSMPLKHLQTFIQPFALGNPKLGSYPPFYEFDGSIFWENNGYLGLLPLFLSLSAIVWSKRKKFIHFWVFIFVLSLLLAWGKYSPLYFVYGFWPLTLFRVPSRFIWTMVYAIVMLGALGTSTIFSYTRKPAIKALFAIILFIHTVLLMNTFWSYHLIVDANNWLANPTSSPPTGRTYTIAEPESYNSILERSGWTNESPFWFLREGLSPNSNIIWNIPQHDVLAGRQLKRPVITNQLLADSIERSQTHATISAQTARLMDMFAIGSVRSFLPIQDDLLIPISKKIDKALTLSLFETKDPAPRAYIVPTATTAGTLSEAVKIIQTDTHIPRESVLLQSHEAKTLPSTTPKEKKAIVQINKENDRSISLTITDNPSFGYLVVADTYYPGWIAFVDGLQTPILAANLSQRAVPLEAGDHTVLFLFRPITFTIGSIITILAAVVLFLFAWFHIRKKNQQLLQNRRHNPGR